MCVWKPAVAGEFTTMSAKQLIQQHGALCTWKKWFWKNWLPRKMPFFVWRAKRRAISMDNIIKHLDIPIVSKCECCDQPEMELLHHILCEGIGAQKYRIRIS